MQKVEMLRRIFVVIHYLVALVSTLEIYEEKFYKCYVEFFSCFNRQYLGHSAAVEEISSKYDGRKHCYMTCSYMPFKRRRMLLVENLKWNVYWKS